MSSPTPADPLPQLVDVEFLRFLQAGDPSMAATIRRAAALYAELLTYDWSVEDLIIAAKTGYNYASHAAPVAPRRHGRYNWKAYTGPEALTYWLRHHYEQMKASEIGMSLGDFVAKWCELVDVRPHRDHPPRAIMRDYVRGRRSGLSDDEAAHLALHYPDNEYDKDLYLVLRRKGLSKELVRRIIKVAQACQPRRFPMAQDIFKAYRAGAKPDRLVESIQNRTTHLLAVELRRAARAQIK